jgi:signal transduction histidine kinase
MSRDEKVNILLVDDQPAKLLSYEAMLDDLGDNLIRASSAREALEHLLKTEVAVILIDICMPEIDGFELAAMIRQHPRFQKTAIVLVSAILNTDVDRLRGYDCGAMDFVPVPVVPEILRAKVAVFAELYRKTRELERINETLEERVANRTADLEATTARLQEMQEQLQTADRRKDQFLAVLGHELRNPLAGIVGAIQVLDQIGMESPESKELLQGMVRQANLMQRLIDDLLDVTRIARDKITLHKEPTDLVDFVRRVANDQRRVFECHGQSLEFDMPDGPVMCLADVTRLTQIVANLLNNARKFSDPGGVTRLSLSVNHNAQTATIQIADGGIGMDAQTVSEIFEPFAQAEQSLARNRGGLGLGLALAQRLSEMHGGRISAFSQGPGLGSKFTLVLPLGKTPRENRDQAPAPASQPSGKRCRVLVIDDRHDAAYPIVMTLRLAGHDVLSAADGHSGLQLAHTFQPDVILCDIGLPGMDGYEFARRLKSNSACHQMHLVAITGYGQESDRRRALEAGFDLHLTKPVGTGELGRLIDSVAASRRPPFRENPVATRTS